ncbi:MAG: TIM barrel protein [Bacteroidales bacterium]
MKRRTFLRNLGAGAAALALSPTLIRSCGSASAVPRISLAQWSLNKAFFGGDLNPVDFASLAMDRYGIGAVEYVNGFFTDRAADETFWQQMKTRADDAGVKSLLIMVDDEGDLGVADEASRIRAVENHHKWVHAAKILGCHSIRVNAFGDEDRERFRAGMTDSLHRLGEYAGGEGINVVIENHGLFSSDAALITSILDEVGLSNVGTLPDFGNWCLSAKWGTTQFECDSAYDRYQGVEEFLPYAKGVSAKSYNFDENGDDRIIDYYKMLKIVKDFGYKGHIGIEYEGVEKPEHEGILATKALIEKAWAAV